MFIVLLNACGLVSLYHVLIFWMECLHYLWVETDGNIIK